MSTILVKDCPCEECICVAICRNKLFVDLVSKCKLVADYLYDTDTFSYAHRRDLHNERLQRIHAFLNPDDWLIDPFVMKIIKQQGDELMGPINPINPNDDEITLMLSALRDSANQPILPQIRKALKSMGLQREEIYHYEMTGRRLTSMREFIDTELEDLDDMEKMVRETFDLDRSSDKPKKRAKDIGLLVLCAGGIAIIGTLFILMITSMVSDETEKSSSTTELPAITETAPFKDGDKL